jgi:hypothetical protein
LGEVVTYFLTMRRVAHPMTTDNYRVIWDGIEVGSIGVQQGAAQRVFWSWGLDTIVKVPFETHGEASGRKEAMAAFRAVWEMFAADADRLAAFVEAKDAIRARDQFV